MRRLDARLILDGRVEHAVATIDQDRDAVLAVVEEMPRDVRDRRVEITVTVQIRERNGSCFHELIDLSRERADLRVAEQRVAIAIRVGQAHLRPGLRTHRPRTHNQTQNHTQ